MRNIFKKCLITYSNKHTVTIVMTTANSLYVFAVLVKLSNIAIRIRVITGLADNFFLIIGSIIIVAIIWEIGLEKVYMEFLKVNLYFLGGAFLLSLLAIILKTYRWNNLFRIAKTKDASRVYLIGMAVNQIMPDRFLESFSWKNCVGEHNKLNDAHEGSK